jgi:ketosteroid isomerase-like protein
MQSEQNTQSQEKATRKAIETFNEAFNRHDADGLAKFLTEDTVFEDATVLWVYHKMRSGQPWHLRGVDVFTVRDGKVAAKLAYVKG